MRFATRADHRRAELSGNPHGDAGRRNTDGNGVLWSTYGPNPILGDDHDSNPETPLQMMWRWQSLRDFVYPQILETRSFYPERKVFSGFEWNVPGHEHCSTAIVAENANAISAFEFQFDKSDADTSRIGEETAYGTLTKDDRTPASSRRFTTSI